MQTTSARFGPVILVDSNNDEHYLTLETDSGLPDGWCCVRLRDVDGVDKATPIRFKLAGSKIAADFPACDPNLVTVDEDGHITNG